MALLGAAFFPLGCPGHATSGRCMCCSYDEGIQKNLQLACDSPGVKAVAFGPVGTF